MKKTTVLKLFVCVSVVLLYSCNKYDDCASVLPKFPEGFIKIVDKDGNSLLGMDNVYNPSEILFFGDNDTIPTQPSENENPVVLFFSYGPMQSNVDYYLSLNETETDTLNFTFVTTESTCFDVKSIEEVRINGTISEESSGDSIIIIKNNAAQAD